MEKIIDLIPRKTRKLSAKEFLDLGKHEKQNITEVHFELPKLGKPGFGSFVIKTKTPTYSIEDGEEK